VWVWCTSYVQRPTQSSSIDTIKSISEPNSAVLISSDGSDSLKEILKNANVKFVISLHERSCVANYEYYRGARAHCAAADKYPQLADKLLLNSAESYHVLCGYITAPIRQDSTTKYWILRLKL
jgi:hypothetical protein